MEDPEIALETFADCFSITILKMLKIYEL